MNRKFGMRNIESYCLFFSPWWPPSLGWWWYTLDGCGSMEIFSYMTNLLDQFLLKDKSHFFVYEYEKVILLQVIKKLCFMHAMHHFFFPILNLSI